MIDYIMVCILCVLMIIVNIIVLQSYSLDGKLHLKNVIISGCFNFWSNDCRHNNTTLWN